VQRICRYPLLVQELIRYTEQNHVDYSKLNQALEKIAGVVGCVNKQRQAEAEIGEVAEMLHGLRGAKKFGVKLLVPGRRFIEKGKLKIVIEHTDDNDNSDQNNNINTNTNTNTTTTNVNNGNGFHSGEMENDYLLFSDLLVIVDEEKKGNEKKKKNTRHVKAMVPFNASYRYENSDGVQIVCGTWKYFLKIGENEKTKWLENLSSIQQG